MRVRRYSFEKFAIVKKNEIVKCTHCGSERLDSVGDVLICVHCGGARAIN